ncbi:DNA-directed RNA polymerase subunit H [Candidatus Woesearchaeota archaeon]|nr:DNA-directed RNA polymerase subunit H [Candidatus Woesearchaeota archaeon]
MAKAKTDVSKHILVPKHAKLSDKEKKEVLERYNASERELPKILQSDSGIMNLNASAGDVIKITRDSPTAGEITYYRVVING